MLITPLLQHLPLPLLPLLLLDRRLSSSSLLNPHQLSQLPSSFSDSLLFLSFRILSLLVVVLVLILVVVLGIRSIWRVGEVSLSSEECRERKGTEICEKKEACDELKRRRRSLSLYNDNLPF